MSEAKLSRTLVDALRRKGAVVHRVENAISSGLPDIYVAYKGRSFWVETKVVKKNCARPHFERAQPVIINRLANEGVPVFVVVRNDEGEIWTFKAPLTIRDGEIEHSRVWIDNETSNVAFDLLNHVISDGV